jgi:hypothetical protein
LLKRALSRALAGLRSTKPSDQGNFARENAGVELWWFTTI